MERKKKVLLAIIEDRCNNLPLINRVKWILLMSYTGVLFTFKCKFVDSLEPNVLPLEVQHSAYTVLTHWCGTVGLYHCNIPQYLMQINISDLKFPLSWLHPTVY